MNTLIVLCSLLGNFANSDFAISQNHPVIAQAEDVTFIGELAGERLNLSLMGGETGRVSLPLDSSDRYKMIVFAVGTTTVQCKLK